MGSPKHFDICADRFRKWDKAVELSSERAIIRNGSIGGIPLFYPKSTMIR